MRARLGGVTQRGEAPFLHVRVPPRLRTQLTARARKDRVQLSVVVRRGLEWYLEQPRVEL